MPASCPSARRLFQTLDIVRRAIAFVLALAVATCCKAQTFVAATIAQDGSELVFKRADGKSIAAPKSGDQDGFAKPNIAPDGRAVGWLALYPNLGATYSQPLSLVLLDQATRVRVFEGEFGMIYGWCFVDAGKAVAFMYNFSHGITPIGYEKRRIRDGKLLARKRLEPILAGENEDDILRRRTPAWAQCALSSARAE